MIAPLFQNGFFGLNFSYVLAFFIGISFGYLLEKSGFGNARKIAAEFYFEDFTMFKVFFMAIVVNVIGIFFLSWFGVLNLNLVFIPPTYISAQLFGGLVLGFGFGLGAYCPGTSLVSAATGKLDGMAFVAGVFVGTMSFGDIFYKPLKGIYFGGYLGRFTLQDLFNVNPGVMAFFVIVMAIASFWLVEKTERQWDPYRKYRKGPKINIDR